MRFNLWQEQGFFSSAPCVEGLLADPALCPVNTLSPRMKVNNAWDYTLPSPYVFVGRCLIKHRGNFKSYHHTYMGHPVQLGEIQTMSDSLCFYGVSLQFWRE